MEMDESNLHGRYGIERILRAEDILARSRIFDGTLQIAARTHLHSRILQKKKKSAITHLKTRVDKVRPAGRMSRSQYASYSGPRARLEMVKKTK